MNKNDDETLDALTCGNLFVLQKKQGYRYSLDAYLLAAFVEESPGARVLDIGSGSGVISLLLAAMKGLFVTGIEIQEPIAEMARRSVQFAGLQERIEIVSADIREYSGPAVDAVVSNPPYRPVWTGRINCDQGKAIARHEISLDLDTLLACSSRLLKPGGRFYLVYPVWRLTDLIAAMRSHRIEPKRIMFVHSTTHSPAEMCLVCGTRDGGKELCVKSPFFVFAHEGIYTQEMEGVFRELRLPKSH
ncbi:MAG TPA: methyltransferase [Deltaproteobacteria bacterium]|nr:methyltransferase [Deltaproteobacteria bacterium]